MKQRIRRIWLALCMAVCLFALAGCSAAADTAETIDPQIEMAMQSGSQQYLDLFNQMDDASIEQALATSVKNKDTVMENALKSWDSIKDELGAFVSSETAVVTKSDDGYVARMNTVYEKRAMEFTLIADEDLNKVETISFSPVYTTGEKMAKAGMNTLMGMGVVFAVLIFISWLISMFKYINVFEAKMKAKKAAAAPAPAAAPTPTMPVRERRSRSSTGTSTARTRAAPRCRSSSTPSTPARMPSRWRGASTAATTSCSKTSRRTRLPETHLLSSRSPGPISSIFRPISPISALMRSSASIFLRMPTF